MCGRWREPEVCGPGVSKEPTGPLGARQHGSVPGEGPCHPQAQVLRALVSLGEAEGTQSISVCPTPAMAEETEAEGQTVTFLGPTASRWQG